MRIPVTGKSIGLLGQKAHCCGHYRAASQKSMVSLIEVLGDSGSRPVWTAEQLSRECC